ncbi:PLP-dependent aminotransferase family protein [Pseudonocardia sp. CA-107938]|uniref:MocR-like transcription factor YczR n=1 Tax=Pseudonocardia sp. CA-107938 TaxID=3240021 RepID=UPI003D8CC354
MALDHQFDQRIGARSFARLLGEWRPQDGRGLATALAERVRLLVLDGRLPLQTRVPAERELAAVLDVSRTTVAAAYDALRDEEVLHSRRGAGSWTQLPGGALGSRVQPFAPSTDPDVFDLALAALPSPTDGMRATVAEAARDLDAHLCQPGYELHGVPELRTAIAARYTARGLPTTPDQVLVTTGAQGALSLIVTALTAPGDRVLVEHPSYPNALGAIARQGARPVPVPMVPGPDGTADWDLDLATAAVRDAAPKLAYLIPDHQNPTGAVLDAAGRERVVDLARRTSTPMIVDETLAELWLEEAPPPPVAAHGAVDSPLVLTIGSASKVFWGGLRVGWIRTSAPMVRRLATFRATIDLGCPLFEQLLAARLLADIETFAPARRAELRAARDRVAGRIAALFPSWRIGRPGGGLSHWVDLGSPDSSRLVTAARRRDVVLAAGPRFGLDGAFERFLRVPYVLRQDRMDEALDRIAVAWSEIDRTTPMADPADYSVA